MNQSRGDWVISTLKKQNPNTTTFIQLTQFSQEQWNDVLSYGGCDIYGSNGTLQLPETWKTIDEKTPINAKLLWWLCWLEITELNDFSLHSICTKIFETLENKFDKNLVKFIFSFLLASREGLNENEIFILLNENNVCRGKS